MGFSLPHIAIVACVVVLLFGGGKISALMGDVGKGISSFKRGLEDDAQGPISTADTTSKSNEISAG